MRYKGRKKPVQFYWEDEVKEMFQHVVKSYDSELSMSSAVLKLVKWAVQEHWLPGYIKKPSLAEQPKETHSHVIENELERSVSTKTNVNKALDIKGQSR